MTSPTPCVSFHAEWVAKEILLESLTDGLLATAGEAERMVHIMEVGELQKQKVQGETGNGLPKVLKLPPLESFMNFSELEGSGLLELKVGKSHQP